MCIAHHTACNCEQVRLPTLGAHDAWRVMQHRFKLVHGAPTVVETCQVPPTPKSIEVVNTVPGRRSRKSVPWIPTLVPKSKRPPFARIPPPACAVQRHPSRILPVTRSKSYNAYSPSNRVKPDPLFTQHYKNKLNSSTHTRHVRN